MEFWMGILIGMHIGKIVADKLEDYCEQEGIISPETHHLLDEIEEVEEELGDILIPK
jgi:hypothetical protein